MVRLGFIIGFIALVGVLLSGLAAYRVHNQELTVDGIAIARAIDVHASLVQDRLTERELLARVASGLFRILSAVIADNYQPAMRWMSAVMGLFIVVAGVLVLANPFDSYVVLGIFIGVGWIIEGLVDLVAGIRGAIHPRWFGYLSGIISIAAGVVMFVLPFTTIPLLVRIGSIFLIIVSLTTLLMMPRRSRTV